MTATITNPECKQGKHANCDWLAMCENCDALHACECKCHTETIEKAREALTE